MRFIGRVWGWLDSPQPVIMSGVLAFVLGSWVPVLFGWPRAFEPWAGPFVPVVVLLSGMAFGAGLWFVILCLVDIGWLEERMPAISETYGNWFWLFRKGGKAVLCQMAEGFREILGLLKALGKRLRPRKAVFLAA